MGFFNLIGIVLPPIIDLINANIKNSSVRFLISFLVCVLFGTILHFAVHLQFAGIDQLTEDILSIFGISQLSYTALYEGGTMQKAIRSNSASNTPQIVTGEATKPQGEEDHGEGLDRESIDNG